MFVNKLIFVIGLPGSGKTYLSKQYPNHILIDDPRIKPEFNEEDNYIICDPHLCKLDVFKEVLSLYPNSLFIFFTNEPEQCIKNVEYRDDGRNIPDEYIERLSKGYDPTMFSSLVSNFLIKKVYKNDD